MSLHVPDLYRSYSCMDTSFIFEVRKKLLKRIKKPRTIPVIRPGKGFSNRNSKIETFAEKHRTGHHLRD
ncbi:predicted protein [Methanosarcina acetivorans C2A]|uniref:Uncharacterized protein n=1 Tax=Methanosarcina acetivorans (strain ATCC 35395 / DSM 2834 / JCM 12185 / C2A) TaxID=188937 RepID=Q8TPC6_METAC|nr:predicted protein [Methanosarcina acetivorans C2A]